MSDAERFRKTCDELLRQATSTANLRDRSRLVNAAIHWNEKALMAGGLAPPTPKPFLTDLDEG